MTDNDNTRRTPVRRIAFCAAMSAAAVALSAAESLVPVPVPAPGVRLGLANVVTLILLAGDRNPAYALSVTVVRCFLAALMFGAFSSLIYSLAGGVVSCMIMWLLTRLDAAFSLVGTSVAGALAHNMTQLAAAAALAGDPAVFGYLPVLLIAGVLTGCATGFAAQRVMNIRMMRFPA